uniref:ALA-interacting subunit n=1 Tax=Vitis vinifera TaxID=29760 RepID=F6HCN3_VITVI
MDPNGGSSSAGAADGASDPAAARRRHSKKPKCHFIIHLCWHYLHPYWSCFLVCIRTCGRNCTRYDTDCVPASYRNDMLAYIQSNETNKTCTRTFLVPKQMKSPVYIYYQLDNFYQNHRRIPVDLEANTELTVVIENNYNTYSFGGKKKLVLSTTSWIGGKNDFLGIAYITLGGLSLFLAISFLLIYIIKPRPLGDPTFLSWNRNPAGHFNFN